MTIEDQIRDEKLQYDINREAPKISALSSGKIDKYEYYTDEEILPSNQQQIIEQARFTYSPLGKAFEKQTKTIQDQGQKQVDTIAALKPKETKPRETKPNEYSNYFLNRLAKIRESFKLIDFNNLIYNFQDPRHAPTSFIKLKGPNHIFKSINSGDVSLKDVEEQQKNIETDIGEIKKGNPRRKSQKQILVISNVENLYKSRKQVIKLFNGYGRNMSQNIYKSKNETGLKILTPKQRLPIALAQIKAGNNSESLLNEIRQSVYSLYQ